MCPATRVSCAILSATPLSQLSAYGTLSYPERRGQIDGRIDPTTATLDAIGLLSYIIPGLITFGAGFAIGAIYLPDAKYSIAPEVLKDAVDAGGKVGNRELETIFECEIGRELSLDDSHLIRHSGSVE